MDDLSFYRTELRAMKIRCGDDEAFLQAVAELVALKFNQVEQLEDRIKVLTAQLQEYENG